MEDASNERNSVEASPEDVVEVWVERIVPGGAGLGHAGGRTLFVELAAPGDKLRVRINRVQGKVAFASIINILEPGPSRVTPPCPYFGRCGGCDFQQMNYAAQLAAKVEIIKDCLRRIARLEPPAETRIVPSPAIWRYRSRARWQYDSLRNRFGYFELGSHQVCDVATCPVLAPELEATLKNLRQRMPHNLSPRGKDDRRAGMNELSEFQAVVGDDGVVALTPAVDERDTGETTRRIGDEHYHLSATSFFQINHTLLEAMIAEATKEAHGRTAIDLYCGVGLFTLPLARRFQQVTGVESNGRAVRYAKCNLAEARLENAQVIHAKVGDWFKWQRKKLADVDFVLLDPPRAGAEGEALAGILDAYPARVSYVSCDPATLARDLKILIAGGYKLDSLAAFDLFPQTHHVETIAHLS